MLLRNLLTKKAKLYWPSLAKIMLFFEEKDLMFFFSYPIREHLLICYSILYREWYEELDNHLNIDCALAELLFETIDTLVS